MRLRYYVLSLVFSFISASSANADSWQREFVRGFLSQSEFHDNQRKVWITNELVFKSPCDATVSRRDWVETESGFIQKNYMKTDFSLGDLNLYKARSRVERFVLVVQTNEGALAQVKSTGILEIEEETKFVEFSYPAASQALQATLMGAMKVLIDECSH